MKIQLCSSRLRVCCVRVECSLYMLEKGGRWISASSKMAAQLSGWSPWSAHASLKVFKTLRLHYVSLRGCMSLPVPNFHLHLGVYVYISMQWSAEQHCFGSLCGLALGALGCLSEQSLPQLQQVKNHLPNPLPLLHIVFSAHERLCDVQGKSCLLALISLLALIPILLCGCRWRITEAIDYTSSLCRREWPHLCTSTHALCSWRGSLSKAATFLSQLRIILASLRSLSWDSSQMYHQNSSRLHSQRHEIFPCPHWLHLLGNGCLVALKYPWLTSSYRSRTRPLRWSGSPPRISRWLTGICAWSGHFYLGT